MASRLDFNMGLEFQDEILRYFKLSLHHPHPSPDASFFLLATFRRYVFRLMEDSVSLSL
jgi:hypothetical protein